MTVAEWMSPGAKLSWWTRFWHEPVRAERLAVTRIFFGVALLTDQLFQYLPHFDEFFGPGGVAPAGLHDQWLLKQWYWPILFTSTDQPAVLYPLFFVWVAATVLFILGWHTRVMGVLVWFLGYCFLYRNPCILNGGDDALIVGLFLLMLSPTGKAFSLDAWRLRKGLDPKAAVAPALTPAWPVRVFQIQLCLIYLSTGLVKLKGTGLFQGMWWDGTSVHYAINYITMSRFSYAQLPVPFWMTAALTYASVWWETLFTLLVMNRWTRKWALWFGILFHIGIYLSIEVGWFSFYTMAYYGVWIPGEFWDRFFPKVEKQPLG